MGHEIGVQLNLLTREYRNSRVRMMKIWVNTIDIRERSEEERAWRVHRAVISKVYSGCIIIRVDFTGTHKQKMLPPPQEE